jgi:hypothetical protein
MNDGTGLPPPVVGESGENGVGVGTGGGIVPLQRLVPPKKIKLTRRAELTTSLSEPGKQKNRESVEYFLEHGKTMKAAMGDALKNQAQAQPVGGSSTYHSYLYSDDKEDQDTHEEAIAKAIIDPSIDEFRYERIHDSLSYNPERTWKNTKIIGTGVLFFGLLILYRYKYELPRVRAAQLRARQQL